MPAIITGGSFIKDPYFTFLKGDKRRAWTSPN